MPLVSGVCRTASAPKLSHGGSRLNASKPEANPKTRSPSNTHNHKQSFEHLIPKYGSYAPHSIHTRGRCTGPWNIVNRHRLRPQFGKWGGNSLYHSNKSVYAVPILVVFLPVTWHAGFTACVRESELRTPTNFIESPSTKR